MANTSAAEMNPCKKPCRFQKWLTVILIGFIILCCTIPMGFLGLWNGENAGHRNQYELLTEAFLDGKLYIDYQQEDQLTQLENPYDPDEREAAGVEYHWDHSYYNGRYYVYFGVVPVFVLFLPYRLITGNPLTTYHATQVFVAFTIVGIFALFDMLRKGFFKNLSAVTSFVLAAVFSVITVQYSIAEPALYCTAITAALAFQIWSIFFFVKSVWFTEGENKQLVMAFIGALLGALTFGCRPTIALANLLVIPMLVRFLRQRKFTLALFGKLVLAALPYFVVAVLLMLYNYARFEDPFEFGQSYQLTMYDISAYSETYSLTKLKHMVETLTKFWFLPPVFSKEFPFIDNRGILLNYPVWIGLLGMCLPSFWKKLGKEKLIPTVVGICIVMAIVSVLEILWSPVLMSRYQMDLYFLLCIFCYIVIGFTAPVKKHIRLWNGTLIGLSAISLLLCVIYYIAQLAVYYPETIGRIGQLLPF